MLKTVIRHLRGRKSEPLPALVEDATIPADENGNRIRLAEGLTPERGFHLVVEGSGNYLDIQAPREAGQLFIHLGGRSHISIGAGCILRHVQIYASPGATIEIGANVFMNGACRFLAHEPRRIRVGSGCLLASNIDVSVSDMHSILDRETGKRINPGRDVSIGENVWVGQGVNVMKGAVIGCGSVIGMGAIVTRAVPEHCIAAGAPARVVRRGVRWVHELL